MIQTNTPASPPHYEADDIALIRELAASTPEVVLSGDDDESHAAKRLFDTLRRQIADGAPLESLQATLSTAHEVVQGKALRSLAGIAASTADSQLASVLIELAVNASSGYLAALATENLDIVPLQGHVESLLVLSKLAPSAAMPILDAVYAEAPALIAARAHEILQSFNSETPDDAVGADVYWSVRILGQDRTAKSRKVLEQCMELKNSNLANRAFVALSFHLGESGMALYLDRMATGHTRRRYYGSKVVTRVGGPAQVTAVFARLKAIISRKRAQEIRPSELEHILPFLMQHGTESDRTKVREVLRKKWANLFSGEREWIKDHHTGFDDLPDPG